MDPAPTRQVQTTPISWTSASRTSRVRSWSRYHLQQSSAVPISSHRYCILFTVYPDMSRAPASATHVGEHPLICSDFRAPSTNLMMYRCSYRSLLTTILVSILGFTSQGQQAKKSSFSTCTPTPVRRCPMALHLSFATHTRTCSYQYRCEAHHCSD